MHAVVGARRIRARAVARTGAGSSGTLAWQLDFFLQNLRQNLNPVTKLGRGLDLAFVLEFGPVPADDLAPGATDRTIVWEYESPGQFPGALCFLVGLCLRAQCQRTSAMLAVILAVILVAKVGRRRHNGGYANTAICRDNTRPGFDSTA